MPDRESRLGAPAVLRPVVRHLDVALPEGLERLEVEPGAEGAAFAPQDHRAHVRILGDLLSGLVEPVEDGRGHRVQLVRAIERDGRYAVLYLHQHDVGHGIASHENRRPG